MVILLPVSAGPGIDSLYSKNLVSGVVDGDAEPVTR